MIADDVTGVVFDPDGVPAALPAFPAFRLWRDSLDAFGFPADPSRRVRPGLEKYYCPAANFHNQPMAIRSLVILSAHAAPDFAVRHPEGAQRVSLVSRHVFRKRFLAGMQMERDWFSASTAIADRVDVIQIVRPAEGVPPQALCDRIVEYLESPARAATRLAAP